MRGVSLEVPCQAPLWTPSPHLQLLQDSILLCPRALSSPPLHLLDLGDPAPCLLVTPLKTPWTPPPQQEALRTRGLQGQVHPSQFAPAQVLLPLLPHLCPQTPFETTPPPAPWTPTSCNPWDTLRPQLISAICMMMEHLHFDCCILSPFWSQSLFGTFAL